MSKHSWRVRASPGIVYPTGTMSDVPPIMVNRWCEADQYCVLRQMIV